MWDTAAEMTPHNQVHLSHDRPCPDCGHGEHVYLPCSDTCDCVPVWRRLLHSA